MMTLSPNCRNTHLREWQNDDWNVLSENYGVAFPGPRFMAYIKRVWKNTFGLVKSLIKPLQACSESQKCNKADISDSLNHFLNLLALCCGWFLHKFSTNNSETTSNIVSQIRACDKQDCFMSLLLISVFILMVRNFDFCMLRDGGKNSSLSVKWSCFLAHCVHLRLYGCKQTSLHIH